MKTIEITTRRNSWLTEEILHSAQSAVFIDREEYGQYVHLRKMKEAGWTSVRNRTGRKVVGVVRVGDK